MILLVAATTNLHKLQEIRRLLRGTGIAVRSLDQFSPLPAVREDGRTLTANAAKKARAVSRALGLPALSDDSGLFVPALGNQPGVKSARYAGPACDTLANNRKLLSRMKKMIGRERRAYFATTMVLAVPGKRIIARTGKIWGRILETPRGRNGFGYDPVFVPQGSEKTFAEMSASAKNRISHRGRALRAMAQVIRKTLRA